MFILKKQEKGPYWPRLLKDTKKVHWLKADWNKWKDEDDEEEEDVGGQGNDFDSMFKQMGGLGGLGGAGGFGGPGFGGPGFGADDMPNLDDLVSKSLLFTFFKIYILLILIF
jgi:cytosolic prostaglandin-E synthase